MATVPSSPATWPCTTNTSATRHPPRESCQVLWRTAILSRRLGRVTLSSPAGKSLWEIGKECRNCSQTIPRRKASKLEEAKSARDRAQPGQTPKPRSLSSNNNHRPHGQRQPREGASSQQSRRSTAPVHTKNLKSLAKSSQTISWGKERAVPKGSRSRRVTS